MNVSYCDGLRADALIFYFKILPGKKNILLVYPSLRGLNDMRIFTWKLMKATSFTGRLWGTVPSWARGTPRLRKQATLLFSSWRIRFLICFKNVFLDSDVLLKTKNRYMKIELPSQSFTNLSVPWGDPGSPGTTIRAAPGGRQSQQGKGTPPKDTRRPRLCVPHREEQGEPSSRPPRADGNAAGDSESVASAQAEAQRHPRDSLHDTCALRLYTSLFFKVIIEIPTKKKRITSHQESELRSLCR